MNESNIAGISVRGIIVLFLVIVFGITIFTDIKNDALNSLVLGAVGWYFGQKSPQPSNSSETQNNAPLKTS
jgi:hypothetical protein